MDLIKLSKKELIDKCNELGIIGCKSKNKDIIIELINKFILTKNIIIPKEDNPKSINIIDLFCGCGGMSKGLTDAGLNIIAGIDIWDKAINNYKKKF